MKQYIQETGAEMKHVTWPTRRQTWVYTGIVIALSLIVSAYLGILDTFFLWLMKFIVPALGN